MSSTANKKEQNVTNEEMGKARCDRVGKTLEQPGKRRNSKEVSFTLSVKGVRARK